MSTYFLPCLSPHQCQFSDEHTCWPLASSPWRGFREALGYALSQIWVTRDPAGTWSFWILPSKRPREQWHLYAGSSLAQGTPSFPPSITPCGRAGRRWTDPHGTEAKPGRRSCRQGCATEVPHRFPGPWDCLRKFSCRKNQLLISEARESSAAGWRFTAHVSSGYAFVTPRGFETWGTRRTLHRLCLHPRSGHSSRAESAPPVALVSLVSGPQSAA